MSVITCHTLEIAKSPDGKTDIEALLRGAGLLCSKKMFYYNYKKKEGNFLLEDDILDYTRTPLADEFRKEFRELGIWVSIPRHDTGEGYISAGFKAVKYDPKTGYTRYRKDYTEEELDGRLGQRVRIEPGENSSVYWMFNYWSDARPALAISAAFPEIEFEYSETIENSLVCHCILKNGKNIKELKNVCESA